LIQNVAILLEKLGKARLLSGQVAPFLDNGLLHLSGVSSGPGADLLGDINTLLCGLELGDKLGHMGTSSLGLKSTFLLGGILNNGLGFIITDLSSLLESTACRGTQLSGLLGTSGDGSVLLDSLLLNIADLSGPLGALGEGGVSRSLISTLLILNSCASDNIILNIMFLLLGPALTLILGPTDLRSLDVTILDKRSSTDLNSLIKGNLLIINETVLSEVLLTLFLLLRLIVGDIGGMTPTVIAMVTLNNLIILSLFNHLNLVNTTLAIRSRSSSSNSREAHINIIRALTVGTGRSKVLCRN